MAPPEPDPLPELYLRDGPYRGSRFCMATLQDTLLIADEPLPELQTMIDPHDPPVPVAVYELIHEFRGPDGDREGTYTYTGRRYPRGPR